MPAHEIHPMIIERDQAKYLYMRLYHALYTDKCGKDIPIWPAEHCDIWLTPYFTCENKDEYEVLCTLCGKTIKHHIRCLIPWWIWVLLGAGSFLILEILVWCVIK